MRSLLIRGIVYHWKRGEKNEKLIFKVLKRGEKLNLNTAQNEADVVDFDMRYDLTGIDCCRFGETVAGEMDIKKGWKYYMGVFLLNGMSGVIATIHQSADHWNIDSGSYAVWTRIVPLVICAVIQLISEKKIVRISAKVVPYTVGYAAFCGIGNLFLLIALKHLPASVQYPVVTGGTMVFSTIISAVRKEKLTARMIVSAVLALLATVLII